MAGNTNDNMFLSYSLKAIGFLFILYSLFKDTIEDSTLSSIKEYTSLIMMLVMLGVVIYSYIKKNKNLPTPLILNSFTIGVTIIAICSVICAILCLIKSKFNYNIFFNIDSYTISKKIFATSMIIFILTKIYDSILHNGGVEFKYIIYNNIFSYITSLFIYDKYT